MSKVEFDEFRMESLLDDDLMYFIRTCKDIKPILSIFKENNKEYKQYIAQLGKMTANSNLVKMNLPRISKELYRKRDPQFNIVFSNLASSAYEGFIKVYEDYTKKEYRAEDIEKMSASDICNMLIGVKEASKENEVDLDLLWIQFRLLNVFCDEEKKQAIIDNWNNYLRGEAEQDIQGESTNDDFQEDVVKEETAEVIEKKPVIVVKKASKKLTPQEKAQKSKEAAERKKQAEKEQKEAMSAVVETEEVVSVDDEPIVETFSPKDEIEVKNHKSYVCKVEIRGTFYNIAPIGEISGNSYYSYSENEIDQLIPLSQFRNINLNYSVWDSEQCDRMQARFKADQLVIADFETEELQENRDSNGVLNQTGYRMSCFDEIKKGNIRFPSDDGWYVVKNEDVLESNLRTSKVVYLNYQDATEGEKILINLKNGFYAGPYEVKYSATRVGYYIRPDTPDHKYVLSGYNASDCIRTSFEREIDGWNNEEWFFYRVKTDAVPVLYDVITDQDLLSSLAENVDVTSINISDKDGIAKVLETYKNSVLVGEGLTDEIKKNRIHRIHELLDSQDEMRDNHELIMKLLSDMVSKYKDSDLAEELVSTVIEKDAAFTDKFQSMRIIQTQIESAKQELASLKQQQIEAKASLSSSKEEAPSLSVNDIVTSEMAELKTQYDELAEKYKLASDIDELSQRVDSLKSDVSYYDSHKSHLMNDTKDLESHFVELINDYAGKMTDLTFDGYMSSKMLQAASAWESENEEKKYNALVDGINSVVTSEMTKDELVDYLVAAVQSERPRYDKNTIINLLTCITQGFLTVFSGAPGCGKTSICNILSRVLGIDNYIVGEKGDEKEVSRYIPVSVERGWTSKRDFIGYYNPLTKSFEESNRDVFEGLRMLDIEYKKGYSKFPYMILLDEANLSPMEYYWADFMNICDDQVYNNSVNLGNSNVFKIPESLRFVATINNDHTTETLSPRLVDRAWIINLPKNNAVTLGKGIENVEIKKITWSELSAVFGTNSKDVPVLDREVQKIYDGIRERLSQVGINISSRADMAIKKYCSVASELMVEDEYGNLPSVISLDYAISQKVLPKLAGGGESYADWLKSLKDFCTDSNMYITAEKLGEIIKRGELQMNYYQYFS